MTWTYVQSPADGTVFMEWLPAGMAGGQIQARFASDGFVWADAERTFTMDVKGYVSVASWILFSFSFYFILKKMICIMQRMQRTVADVRAAEFE